MTLVLRAIALLCAVLAGPSANAQTYPSKPITIVVPFGPGSGSDLIGRIVGQRIGTVLGQSVIIENKPGANGAIAAAPGRTLRAGRLHDLSRHQHPHVGGAVPNKTVAYDPVKDFAAMCRVGSFTQCCWCILRHSGNVRPGTDRPRQGQPRQAVVRQRQRLSGGGGRNAQAHRGPRPAARALSQLAARRAGRAGRPGVDAVQRLGHRIAAPHIRRAARPCHHAHATQRAGAGAADLDESASKASIWIRGRVSSCRPTRRRRS